MRKVVLILVCLLSVPGCFAQSAQNYYVNVRDYGAKGDGVTDDSLAVMKAVNVACTRGIAGGNVVYFPPTYPHYLLASPVVLRMTKNYAWCSLALDGPIRLGSTLEMGGGFIISGRTSGTLQQFSTNRLGFISVAPGVSPAIHVVTAEQARLENLQLAYPTGDGIVIEDSHNIVLENVWVQNEQNSPGVPLRIRGNFGYTIEDGGFISGGSSPSVEFSDAGQQTYLGLFSMKGTLLVNRGMSIIAPSGGMNGFDFENILFENAQNAFLTIDTTSNIGAWGINIKSVRMADSQGNPKPPLIDAHHSSGPGIWGIKIENSSVDGPWLTTGDPILDLEVWNPDPRVGYRLAQSKYYVLHLPGKIIDTMPHSQGDGPPDFNVSANPNAITIDAGQTANFPLTVSPFGGFNQVVNFTCAGAPKNQTCSVSPSSVSLDGDNIQTATVSVTTSGYSVVYPLKKWDKVFLPAFSLLVLFCLVYRSISQPKHPIPAFSALILICLMFSSCAEVSGATKPVGGSGPPAGQGTNPPTQRAPYSITVTATSGNLTHTCSLTMNVR